MITCTFYAKPTFDMNDLNTLVGKFVNIMHKYGRGSGKLANPRENCYNVVIGKSQGCMTEEIAIYFSLSDVSGILTGPDVIVIMLKEPK